jgi:hypothetical protein
MPSRAGFRFRPVPASQESSREGDPRPEAQTETAYRWLSFLLGLLRAQPHDRATVPVHRVFYRFESGGWRSRSTRQLDKVYRCR